MANKTFTNYLTELLVVAFGVFLGLFVSESRAEKQVEIKVEKSLQYILKELETNRASLESSISYHKEIKSSFDTIRQSFQEVDLMKAYYSNKAIKLTNIPGWKGVRLPAFENVSFESGKLSSIFQEIDLDLINSISRVYNHQEFVTDFGKKLLDKMIAIDSNTKVLDVIAMIELLTTDILSNEIWLQKQIEQTIETLEEKI